MADLTVESSWVCSSARDFSTHIVGSGGDSYRVDYDNYTGWHCSCKGFKYRGHCTHVEQAKEKQCGWNQWNNSGDAITAPVSDEHPNGYCCPDCGGEVTAERWGV